MQGSKNAILILFCLLLVGKSMVNAYMTVYYHFDKESFTQNYCENLDKPELKCHGSCKMDKMADANESEKRPDAVLELDISSFVFTYEEPSELVSDLLLGLDKRIEICYLNTYSSTEINDVFHPPQA